MEVDSEHFTLSVTETRVKDLLSELSSWSSREFYTLRQLQSLLGKLSFVTAYVKPGCIFMSRLLNSLRAFPSTRVRLPVSANMKADIAWWLAFLPLFNGTSLISLNSRNSTIFSLPRTHHCIVAGRLVLTNVSCASFPKTSCAVQNISPLYNSIVVAVKFWASKLSHRKFLVSCDNEAAVTVVNSGS